VLFEFVTRAALITRVRLLWHRSVSFVANARGIPSGVDRKSASLVAQKCVFCGAYRSGPTIVVVLILTVVVYIFMFQTYKILTSFYIYKPTTR
jgi:hypothetical protein